MKDPNQDDSIHKDFEYCESERETSNSTMPVILEKQRDVSHHLQSIQTAAVHAQQEATSQQECDAITTVASELVSGFATAPLPINPHTEEDIRTSSPDSQEPTAASGLDKEVRRLQVLKSYLGVLDTDHGNKFERLTTLASRIFKAPMALVTIADLDKQYCISSRGVDYKSTRHSPFCSHAVLANCDILVVADALQDPRFAKDARVTAYPKVRFYAGAPLICPEGHRMGTLCVMDPAPRVDPVTLDEKQSLMELAAMAMENLVELRTKKQHALKDPAQQIACTAHDLLTPLTGIALSLSLLKEDDGLQQKLTEPQRDMIETAANCSAVMNSICHKTMDFFRDQGRTREDAFSPETQSRRRSYKTAGPSKVTTSDLVKNLNMVMEPFPKQVPIIITVDPSVPPEFMGDDMKIFRSATNFLTNSCAKTESGSIHFRIYTRTNAEQAREIVFECEDTGPGVDVAKYAYLFKPVLDEEDPLHVSDSVTVMKDVPPGALREGVQNTGLGLYSVASQISSIGGKYGFRPRGVSEGESSSHLLGNGSIFWFCIPQVLPSDVIFDSIEDLKPSALSSQSIGEDTGSGTQKLGTAKRPQLQVLTEDNLHTEKNTVKKLNSEDAMEAFVATPKGGASEKKRYRSSSMNAGRRSQALVIEDSLVVRKSIARVLTKLGFEVTQAVNGMEGLKELKASLFDLVLCDFLMPVMDGLDCVQQYRQWEAVNRPFFTQYIVGISAHASDKDIDQGFKVGLNEFRSKPVTYNELMDLKNGKEFNRIRAELDQLGQEIQNLKRRKLDAEAESPKIPNSDQKVCLVVEGGSVVSKLAKMASETIGWKIVSVMDPDSALGLLKMRNWDAVLVDDELGCSRCISIFREWEKNHRVNRQQNIVLLSANYLSAIKMRASFHVPTGFDGALGKPIQLDSLQSFLEGARTNWEIVTR